MKKLILNIVFLMGYLSLFGQDLHSSNIQNISSNYNPALTALNYRIQGQMSYRSQWRKIGSPFVANGFNMSSNLSPFDKTKNGHLSLGLNFYNEQMSKVLTFNSLSVSSAYHLNLNKTMQLSLGFNVGFIQLKFDPLKGSWESQHNGFYYDPSINSGENFAQNQQTKFDIGSGLVYTYKPSYWLNFQTGVSAYHLNKPNISFYSNNKSILPMRYVGFLSNKLDLLNYKLRLESQILYQHQLKFNSLMFGTMVKLKFRDKSKFTSPYSKKTELYAGLGLYYRLKDAFVVNMSLQKNNWSINLAYDINVSNLKVVSNKRGAIELQLNFLLPYKHY